jgi:hypothetical protein
MIELTITDIDLLKELLLDLKKKGGYRNTIKAFITGYEEGSRGLSQITYVLSTYLHQVYGVEGKNLLDWSDEVELFAQQVNLEWVDAFCRVVEEIIGDGTRPVWRY